MALCRYCGQKASWFTDVHAACVEMANAGVESIKRLMADAVVEGKKYTDIAATIEKLVARTAIPQDQVRAALKDGWSQGTEQRSKAQQPISPEESEAMDAIWRDAGFKIEESYWTAGGFAMMFSVLVWMVLHDKLEEFLRTCPFQGQVNFNLRAREVAVWGLPNVLLK